MNILIRYFGGAREASGTPEEKLDISRESTLSAVIAILGTRHGPALARILGSASFLVNEVSATGDPLVEEGSTVDVLPPFAGG